MNIKHGSGSITIRSEEFLKLLNGFQSQATLLDSEIIYLDEITDHTAKQGKHQLTCIMVVNGLGPYKCQIEVAQLSPNFYLGTATYSYVGPDIFGGRSLVAGE